MNLATLLHIIDAEEYITIINCRGYKTLYKGIKYQVKNVNFDAEVIGLYTSDGEIVIEVCQWKSFM